MLKNIYELDKKFEMETKKYIKEREMIIQNKVNNIDSNIKINCFFNSINQFVVLYNEETFTFTFFYSTNGTPYLRGHISKKYDYLSYPDRIEKKKQKKKIYKYVRKVLEIALT